VGVVVVGAVNLARWVGDTLRLRERVRLEGLRVCSPGHNNREATWILGIKSGFGTLGRGKRVRAHNFIYSELGGGEGHGHSECRRVQDVEHGYPFFSKNGLGASENGAEFGLVHLHSLLYHLRAISVTARVGEGIMHAAKGGS